MNLKALIYLSIFLSIFVTAIACENDEEAAGDLQEKDIRGGGGMPVFLLAGQSNMVGNVDRSLYNDLVYELETGPSGTRQQRLETRLKSWYRDWSDGYASYGYSPQMATLEASELIRLNREGSVNSSLTQPYSKVYCASSESPSPKPLAFNCGNPYGPELILGHLLGSDSSSPTSLIKVAKGGTTLYSDWLPPSAARRTGRSVGPLYEQLSQRIKSLRTNPASVHPNCPNQQCHWAAFVWFQGENDSMDQASAREYQKNLENLISDVRYEIGSPQLPVIIVGMGRWAQNDLEYGKTVVAAQQAVATADPYAKFVATDDLSGFYHYDSAGQLIVGERIAKKLIPMLKNDNGGGGENNGDCSDTPGFVDASGWWCADWVGYDCGLASEDYGFTAKEEQALKSNCQKSCGLCQEGEGSDSGGGGDVPQGADALLGHYERRPVENFYHEVDIVHENGGFWWRIGSGSKWSLSYADGALKTGSDCPYGQQTIKVVRQSGSGAVTELVFDGERYYKVGGDDGGGGDGAGGGDAGGGSSYNGSGRLLRFEDHNYILSEVDPNEADLLKKEGFTKKRIVSVGNWTKIFTIQATSLVDDKVLKDIAVDAEYLLRPIVARYPDRLRKVLDRKGGTFNVLVVYGSGWGLSGGMGDGPQVYKRWGAYGGGLHHEMGHIFDIWSASSQFRSHVDSILSAEDAAIMDRHCGNTKDPKQTFINNDGSCQYSEFIAEQYHWMSFPDTINKVKTNLPEVYQVMLKYIPEPSNRVPVLQ